MATLAEQPKNINPLADVQFKFTVTALPNTTFFIQTVNLPGYGTIFKIDNCGEGFLMRGVCELINGVETALKVFFYPLNILLESFPVLLKQ